MAPGLDEPRAAVLADRARAARAAGRELAAEGLRFADPSLAFVDVRETLYVNPCHSNPRGNELLAFALLERFPTEVLSR